jgi:hypothetical protein
MKTSELTGPALDWAVAKCEGHEDKQRLVRFAQNTPLIVFIPTVSTDDGKGGWYANFSTDWAQGGPIIEREVIGTWSSEGGHTWHARGGLAFQDVFNGPTPLIAAMRCYVASKLGAEVDLPSELINEGESK